MRRYVEVSTNGIDETLQGISSSAYLPPVGTAVGLRVPTAALPQRYLFLLATRVCSKPTRIRGVRQLLTIGATLPAAGGEVSPGPITNPVELEVKNPAFKFLDGNVSWHIVREPNTRRRQSIPPLTDTTSFRQIESDGPALLYQTAGFAAGTTNPITGAPLFYQLAINAYTPPAITGDWQPLAESLGNFSDIRFPWNAASAWESADIDVPVIGGQQRVSFYASVLQTSAGSLTIPAYPSPIPTGSTLPDEVKFILTNADLSPPVPTMYWRVAGSLIFDDGEVV